MTPSAHWNAKQRGEVIAVRLSKARQHWDIGVADEPHTFALASGVLTHNSKPNPMPESVTDRPTKAHEYLFLLSKGPRYFYDADAIREPAVINEDGRIQYLSNPSAAVAAYSEGAGRNDAAGATTIGFGASPNGRNKRSVWTVATQPYAGAHFATFPPRLIEPCVLAGSPKRACASCGTPMVIDFTHETSTTGTSMRTVRADVPATLEPPTGTVLQQDVFQPVDISEPSLNAGLGQEQARLCAQASTAASNGGPGRIRSGAPPRDGGTRRTTSGSLGSGASQERSEGRQQDREPRTTGEVDARPTSEARSEADHLSALQREDQRVPRCPSCGGTESRPAVVLDPFSGAGTTGVVAGQHGRDYIGIELNPEYAEMAQERIALEGRPGGKPATHEPAKVPEGQLGLL